MFSLLHQRVVSPSHLDDIDECASWPCAEPYQKCIDQVNMYKCDCQPGYQNYPTCNLQQVADWSMAVVGCFVDQHKSLDLPSASYSSPSITQSSCVLHCQNLNYLYAGVQSASVCYCGNSINKYGRSTGCTQPCNGDSSIMCGGYLSNNVMHTGLFRVDQKPIGCYADEADRDLSSQSYYEDELSMTQANCSKFCYNKMYKYAAVQNGTICFCGNTYGRYGSSDDCNITCAGEHVFNTTCGGVWANTVLDTGYDLDDCLLSNCTNNATCVDRYVGYTCQCVTGFTGFWCETNIDECVSSPCPSPYSFCADGINRYDCTCYEGYQGPPSCQLQIVPDWSSVVIGCYIDIQNTRDLPYSTPLSNLTPLKCISHCQQLNYLFAAVQNGDDCFCGNSYGKYGRGSGCTSSCNGDASETCGGYLRNEVMHTGLYNVTKTIDCYGDNDVRDLPNSIVMSGNMSRTECSKLCFNQGYHYAGAQARMWCLCGNSFGRYGLSSSCDMVCPGDHYGNTTCGGNWTNTIMDTGFDIDDCLSANCTNNATCVDQYIGYRCSCVVGFTGVWCETDVDECLSRPCQHNSNCTQPASIPNYYYCTCEDGYTGVNCEVEINECNSAPCRNAATCNNLIAMFSCTCVAGYTGVVCESDINECQSNPCSASNSGSCVDNVNAFFCPCFAGYTGVMCEMDINECSSAPCLNSATCSDAIDYYTCSCVTGFTGPRCETNINECDPQPCRNGATCVDQVNRFSCTCVNGYTGTLCETDINECSCNPCSNNGTCIDLVNGFNCTCIAGFTGVGCATNIDECSANPCQNDATCLDGINGYRCSCVAGFTGTRCETNMNECDPQPCRNGATCVDQVNRFSCTCVNGYTGTLCETDINECSCNPCSNNGTCIDLVNGFNCTCIAGFTGVGCATNIDECSATPCQNDATCLDGINDYRCSCVTGFTGTRCETNINECDPQPCRNGATCVDQVNRFSCTCVNGYTGTLCETDINECSCNPCSNNGTCIDLVNGFNCTCIAGFAGVRCATNIDECSANPCQNDATCLDGINDYRCSCVAGFTGTRCETNINECDPQPCRNGATCVDQVNRFSCTCINGYTGTLCETNINDCACSPCSNNGTCVDLVNKYTCSCMAGFTGVTCVTNIDECSSSPCENGGTCRDGINSFGCDCMLGFAGIRCEINVNDCILNSCFNGGTCVDGINLYNCVCFSGYTGFLCQTEIDECVSSPCLNNGSCIDLVNGFVCQCSPGYTGLLCQSNINECSSNPCRNAGTCIDELNSFRCICSGGYTGVECDVDIDECLSNPCRSRNNTVCTNQINGYRCDCVEGYSGVNCSRLSDLCASNPCPSYMQCHYINDSLGYTCSCPLGYNGTMCDIFIDLCDTNPCGANGYCRGFIGFYKCVCKSGFYGSNCEHQMAVGEVYSTHCPEPPDVTSRALFVRQHDLYGDFVTYTCLNGFAFIDSSTVRSYVCVNNKWPIQTSDICALVPCVLNLQLNNIKVSTQSIMALEPTAVAQCTDISVQRFTDGTRIQQLKCITVNGFGKLSTVQSDCEANRCEPVPAVNRATVDTSTIQRRVVTVKCLPGHLFSSGYARKTIKCDHDGTWDRVGACEVTFCSSLHVRNGWLSTDVVEYSTVVVATCNEGFMFPNGRIITVVQCNENSVWNDTLSDCIPIVCKDPPSPELYMDVTGLNSGDDIFPYLTTLTYQCSGGRRFNDGTTSRDVVCSVDAQWSGAPLSCELNRCPPVVIFPHMTANSTIAENGTIVHYSCDAGYELSVKNITATMTCFHGTWTSITNYCEDAVCTAPLIQHGFLSSTSIISSVYHVGSMIGINCANGYQLNNNRSFTMVCSDSGEWEPPITACYPVDCGSPRIYPHAIVNAASTFTYLSTANYSCISPRQWMGINLFQRTAVCTANGTWQPVFASGCTNITCLPLISYQLNSTDRNMDSVIEVKCPSDQQFTSTTNNSFIATCNSLGLWTPKIPDCISSNKTLVTTAEAPYAIAMGTAISIIAIAAAAVAIVSIDLMALIQSLALLKKNITQIRTL